MSNLCQLKEESRISEIQILDFQNQKEDLTSLTLERRSNMRKTANNDDETGTVCNSNIMSHFPGIEFNEKVNRQDRQLCQLYFF